MPFLRLHLPFTFLILLFFHWSLIRLHTCSFGVTESSFQLQSPQTNCMIVILAKYLITLFHIDLNWVYCFVKKLGFGFFFLFLLDTQFIGTKRMQQESTSEQEPDDSESEPEFVELDPSGRYGRVSFSLTRFCIWKLIFWLVVPLK